MPNNPNASQNLTPFVAGNNANPGGRPKGLITQFLREYGDAAELHFVIEKVDTHGTRSRSSSSLSTGGQSINQAIAARLLQMALAGDIKAIREVLNRTEGRVPLPINIRRDVSAGAELKVWTGEEVDKYEEWYRMTQQGVETVEFEDLQNEQQNITDAD